MKNWKKAGLTALAGSLVAFSANAGALSVSGSAKVTYTGDTGKNDTGGANASPGVDGKRWGMARGVTFTGSGEMDNGWNMTVSQTLLAGAQSAGAITLDMGDAGTLVYQQTTGALGIGKIDDMMPTASEEVWDGIDTNGTSSSGGVTGKVSGGAAGFNYSNTMGMATINVGYGPKGQGGGSDGANTGAGGNISSTSVTLQITPMDGLSVGIGSGEKGSTTVGQTNDHDTYYATYTWGPVTAGYQHSEIDMYNTTAGYESDGFGILFAVNDEISISYGERDTTKAGTAAEEQLEGIGASYTMGSMSLALHKNKGTNVGQTSGAESEHTEIALSFSF